MLLKQRQSVLLMQIASPKLLIVPINFFLFQVLGKIDEM